MRELIVDVEKLRLDLYGAMRRISKAGSGEFVIGGYASVLLEDEMGNERGDLEDDSVDLDGLDEAFNRMMSVPARRNLMARHSNVQIGEILEKWKDSEGTMWRSQVVRVPTLQYPRKGLFIIARLFDDIEEAKRYQDVMKMGHMLAFSIGGEAKKRVQVCDGKKCVNKIIVMDLFEISSCDKGMNPDALAFIMKGTLTHPIIVSSEDGVMLLKKLRR